MKNSAAILLLGLCLLASGAAAPRPQKTELLKLSRLRQPARGFTLRIDLFQGSGPAPMAAAAPAAQAEALQQSIAEEIAQSVSYEGFILKNARPMALLNVSGEFFSVSEQETILEKIKVLKITKDIVTIEYDGQPYEIPIKGEQNG